METRVSHAASSRTGYRALRIHRTLLRAALAAGNAFAWIFVFQHALVGSNMAHAFAKTALLYALAQDAMLLLTPYAAARLGNGIRTSMRFGILLAAAAFTYLASVLAGYFASNEALGLIGFALLYGAYRAFYWTPYQLSLERSGMPRLNVFLELLIATLPLIAGLVLAIYLPSSFLFCVAIALLLSIIPISFVSESHERYSWGYLQTFRVLGDSVHRKILAVAFLDGIQGAVLLLLWPLAIYLLVSRSYTVFGAILTVSFLFTFAMRSWYRALMNKLGIERSSPIAIAISISSWILRIIVASPIAIIFVDTYFYIGSPNTAAALDPRVFDQAADKGSYIDEYTVLKELGLGLGRIFVCMIAAGIAVFATLPLAFITALILAALASCAPLLQKRIRTNAL